jgi:hypothetical protein
MTKPDWTKCDKCGTDANVIGRTSISDARGAGTLTLIDCPKCGEREQIEIQPGDAEDHTGKGTR